MARIAPRGFIVLTLAVVVVGAGHAQSTNPPSREIVALNRITGSEPAANALKALLDDKANAKSVIAQALPLAKQKEKLRYNASLVLALAAADMKDLPACEVFFRNCIEQAAKLQSVSKLAQSFGGLIEIYFDNKKYDETTKLCQELINLKTDDGKERVVLKAFTKKNGENDFYEDDSFGTTEPLMPFIFRQQVQAMAKQGKYEQAHKVVDNLIKQSKDWRNRKLKGDLFKDAGELDKAAKAYIKLVDFLKADKDISPKEKIQAIEMQVLALAKIRRYDDAHNVVDSLIELDDDWQIRQLKAELYRDAGQLDKAADSFLSLIEGLKNDVKLSADDQAKAIDRTKYLLSNVYVELKQIDKCSELLLDLLKAHPNNPGYNNDLGYIWADNDMKLDEAEKLIRKALVEDEKRRKTDPDEDDTGKANGAYLDSLGWVLYKKKDFAGAKKALAEALEDKTSQHIEIYDHYGDVLFALGERDAAIEAWRKGLEHVTESRRDADRKKLVEEKLKKNAN